MTRFFRVQLRTFDVDAARAFYASVLGESPILVVPLHEQAVARGARPHWLGFLEVPDVARAAATFTERGAVSLAPKWVNPEGVEAAVMRDPGGAIVALAKPPANHPSAPQPEVVWYLLNTGDVERAKANYGELAGWAFEKPVDLGPHGVLHPFVWERGSEPVGWMSDIAGRPGVHPHWMFFFGIPALEAAMDAVRRAGGLVLGPFELPGGQRMAVCDDPQGAAFGLCEAR